MEEIISLQNGTDVAQLAYAADGERHQLDAHQVLPFSRAIAKLFLDQRGQYVSVWKPVQVPLAAPGEEIVYVANVTGNPALAEKVTVKYLDKATKLEKSEAISNPLRIPFPIRRQYAMPQRVITSPGGTKTTFSTPSIPVVIPPWQRVAVPISCAEWLERRDAQQEDLYAGAIVRSRRPTSFEPNDTWDLYEIMVYARLVDDKAQGWIPEKDAHRAVMNNDSGKLAELKIKLLTRLFYYIVDERYALPTKEAFDAALHAALVAFKQDTKGSSARA